MAKKELLTILKLQIPAGKATPAPPIGPALGQHGLNIVEFCKAYNDLTKDKMGSIIPVEISVYKDRTFSLKLKTPPTKTLILKAAGIKKGSPRPNTQIVGSISVSQVDEIVDIKKEDLNGMTTEALRNIIAGSARSMGVKVK